MRVDLEHFCSCSRKQCRIFHGSFSQKNYPLVQIHCIIKMMCQDLPLGCINWLFGVCGEKTKTFAIVREFTFLLESQKFLIFLQSTAMQIVYFVLICKKTSYGSICTICIFTDCCYSFVIFLFLKSCWAPLTWEP